MFGFYKESSIFSENLFDKLLSEQESRLFDLYDKSVDERRVSRSEDF